MPSDRYVLAHTWRFTMDELFAAGTPWAECCPEEQPLWNRTSKELETKPMTAAEQEKLKAELIANRTLVREDEQAPAQVISAQDAEIERLNAELEELKAKMGVPPSLGSGGVTPPEDDTPPAPAHTGGKRR